MVDPVKTGFGGKASKLRLGNLTATGTNFVPTPRPRHAPILFTVRFLVVIRGVQPRPRPRPALASATSTVVIQIGGQ